MLDLAKQPLDLLALTAGGRVGLGPHQTTGVLASGFIDVSGDPPLRRRRRALRFQGTELAIELAGPIVKCGSVMHASGGFQRMTARADIDIARLVIDEVFAGRDVVAVLAPLLYRDVRIDLMLYQPVEHLAGAVSNVAGNVIGL